MLNLHDVHDIHDLHDLFFARTFRPEGDPQDHENVARQLASLCLSESKTLERGTGPAAIYAQRHFTHYTYLLMGEAVHARPDDPRVLAWLNVDEVDYVKSLSLARQIVDEAASPVANS